MRAIDFQRLILKWFDQHGRKQLPWQFNKTPYRVWVSEIMLQQTQVTTVIPYYERFMQQFPDLTTLADASEDQVLHLWAGLGYYSRARNLYKAAKFIKQNLGGKFPDTVSDLSALPGIGRSTAGAILAIAFNQPAPILDGNVKRVLARFHGIVDPINQKTTENKLWELATQYTPTDRVADYTQAMMDLGATLCIRGQPDCASCPLKQKCIAFAQGMAALLPRKQTTSAIPTKNATFLILKRETKILLCKRPSKGIWGGLWSVPEMIGIPEQAEIVEHCRQHYGVSIFDYQPRPAFRHTFSHYHLDIHPIVLRVKKVAAKIMEADKQIWYNLEQPQTLGLPKPMQIILRGLL